MKNMFFGMSLQKMSPKERITGSIQGRCEIKTMISAGETAVMKKLKAFQICRPW